jgi:hypothetical protein
MPIYARAFLALLCITILTSQSLGQTTTKRPNSSPKKNAASTQREREGADPLAEVRRATVTSLVLTLADEARSYRDPVLAARVQARAADALWEADNERARALFRRAWEAADTGDKEAQRRREEERRAQLTADGAASFGPAPNLRAEVLRLAARRDRALGEEFLAKLDEERKREEESGAAKPDSTMDSLDPAQPPPAITQRLRLAKQLLQSGETERALQFADAALARVTLAGLDFLGALRQKDAAAADKRYSALLARAAADPQSDANTISLLSSYVFTPNLYITIEPKGGVNSSRWGDQTPPPDLAPALRQAFLNTAAQIFLRPLPTKDQDRTSGGRAGLYFIIARLLPIFEQHDPEKVSLLRAQLSALSTEVPEDVRKGDNRWMSEGLVPEDNLGDETQDALKRAENAKTAQERDRAYADAARNAANKGDARARDYADKIDDSDLRKAARAYADYELINKALNRKDGPEALRLARTGEITRIQRVWALTEAAYLLKADAARATEVLDEAVAEARRIGGSDPDRARALAAVATRLFEVNRGAAWELMSEVVKAANSSEGFTGEDGTIVARFVMKGSASISSSSAPGFDLGGIFASLAKDDMNRAIELAKGFTGEAPRAAATLAIARSVLRDKGRS